MFQVKKASRKNSYLKIGLFGVSGSGKTYGALKVARGLIGDGIIVVLDTENGSANFYSNLTEFLHLDFAPPFSPSRYIKAIDAILSQVPDVACIIVDSISHEWEGQGGCLDIHAQLGGQFHHWAKVTPMHRKFLDKILQTPIHFIVCGRSKVDYAIEEGNGGRKKVTKAGLKTITKEGFDYELTLSFNIQHNHTALIDKDRTGLFKFDEPILLSEDVGQKLRHWNNDGEIDYYKLFLKLGSRYLGKDKEAWTNVRDQLIDFDKTHEKSDSDYWKNQFEQLQSILKSA